MDPRERPHLGLFLATVIVLAVATILFGRGGTEESYDTAVRPSTAEVVVDSGTTAHVARAARLQAEVTHQAERFVTAFLRYEVGDSPSPVRRELRLTSTRRFFNELMMGEVRPPPSGFPLRATLERLDVNFTSVVPPQAVVSGTALRAEAPEEFVFIFELVGRRWLAAAPGS